MKNLTLLMLLVFCSFVTFAQGAAPATMADEMRSSGKIYVVVGTIAIVFVGLTIYLFAIDRRLMKN